ncbi:pullulanase-type alpha-1,6-glucosidase [Cryobacterium sp. MLB-32]|uniref:pullulanase-type alpha-1,6-glucosidase n=1 Tax=Cryobacterium sp. MLB-32 TaxID=1529318 RepID=UPI000A4B188B
MTVSARLSRVLATLTIAAFVGSALAGLPSVAALAADRTATLVGDLQTEIGCTDDWMAQCSDTVLAPTGVAGVYAAEFTLPAGTYEYKVVIDGSFDEAYGLNGGGDNIPLTLAGDQTLRVTYDDTLQRVALEPLGLRASYSEQDDSLVAAPVRQAGSDEQFYFVMTDRFADGNTANNTAGLGTDPLKSGFDPRNEGFYNGGDIAGLRSQLDYIDGLGTSALWLTPSFTNKPVQGSGATASAGYHGYWVTDFTQIDPHLGTNAELEALIEESHARGIKVYFDIITNHTADVIDYAEGEYGYIDQASSPYRDAAGNTFSPGDFAAADTAAGFPDLDPTSSFAYTPTVAAAETDAKVPAWLNDPTLYHNRGNSTWSGESVTEGDFDGLDDLMTEHPRVVNGFVDVYKDWVDLGIDGFRIDTVKHVNFDFWEQWTTAVLDYAHSVGKPDFFMFAEVYDADPAQLSPYVRKTDMNSVLDFTFQSAASGFAAGNSAATLKNLYAGDDMYTTPNSSAAALPTFLGNHDMGRIGYALQGTDAPLARDQLAHDLMYLTRGQPVVYYGDEQGFAGAGDGKDKNARQSLFATEVDAYANQKLVTGEVAGSVDRFDTSAPMYTHIAELAELRRTTPALNQGAQIERFVDDGPGIYAVSRIDRTELIEHLVAFNNSTEARTVDITTLTPRAEYKPLLGGTATTSDASGLASVTVPALSTVVLRANIPVAAPDAAAAITVNAPVPGAGISGVSPVSAVVDANVWQETSFAWRIAGAPDFTPLGTAEDGSPRVFHDTQDLAPGTLIEYRAISTDAAGQRAGASTFASVGNAVVLTESSPSVPAIDLVTVPGTHNAAMGCAGDWAPGCEAAALSKRADGVYSGTVDIPAGTYEYKVAYNGNWDVNYGASGIYGGANLTYTTAGGPITFYYDPITHYATTSANGPILTLPGSFQDQVGCPGAWAPDCLAAWLQDVDGDGIFTWSTDSLADGSYEFKVAHNLSWAENYGQDGIADGGNFAFSTADGSTVVFRYDPATHLTTVDAADAPLPGTGEARAHWIDESTIAWPTALLPAGSTTTNTRWALHAAPSGGIGRDEDSVTPGPAANLEFDPAGLTAEQLTLFPALKGFLALHPADLTRAETKNLLTGQLMVSQSAASDSAVTALTGIQLPGVLDDLYAADAAARDLGISWRDDRPTLALWAPTAQNVDVLLYDADTMERVSADLQTDGSWTVTGGADWQDREYLYEVTVYVPSTDRVETNLVTDPYSTALTVNSTRSVVVDLDDPDLRPGLWEDTPAPVIESAVDRAIYELHVRDFSITDETVPENIRGTYAAFGVDSDGTRHLRDLAAAGLNTVHLLPSFDIATIEEDRSQQGQPACELASFGPASSEQQACIAAVADTDAFNWGYDPYHFMVPEGSYAVNPHGGARVAEFRGMVGALHASGLQVVLDEVYNHTSASGQGATSVLDKVVPGYYHRLNDRGVVETSTCCQNVATEHALAEKLMVDSVAVLAEQYRVDGFRFDLMGHHSKQNLLAVRTALNELTVAENGIDGSAIYLYGEGWNFGEVAANALFEQASQGQLGGTGIGTFNDRLRDAVHGGSPVDGSSTFQQGFGTGLGTDPNGDPINGTTETALADLGHQTDLVKLGLAGNLRDFSFVAADGALTRGDQLDYRGSPAGYADEPDEVVNYVDAHDNETLFDILAFKLPVDTSMADRVRMNSLSLATVALAQTPSFWHAGTDLLRSKSLDRDSYNSGDWFNAID